MRPRPAQPRGFTLLEVMIVVGMAALVFAISIPFVKRTMSRDAVYQAVHVVEDALRNARATAIFHNAAADVVIQPQEKAFSVAPAPSSGAAIGARNRAETGPDGESGEAPPPPRGFMRHAPKPYSARLAEDVTIELLDVNFTEFRDEETARIRFHPNGTSDEFTIVLKIGATTWRKISLDIVTGQPTLEIMR